MSLPILLSDEAIGLLMREMVVRAIRLIRHMRFSFVEEVKGYKEDGTPDKVTNADTQVQEKIYLKLIREWFPGVGMIGEEAGLRVPCAIIDGNIYYFTIDPLDGTSAFTRRESKGFSSMLALVHNNEIIAVCIGNVLTGELFYYRPGSPRTHRLDPTLWCEPDDLCIDTERPLFDQVLQLREPIDWPHHHPLIRRIAAYDARLFRKTVSGTGSIGLTMSELWTGTVGGCVNSSEKVTPWDETPVLGMSKRLGFVLLKPGEHREDLFEEVGLFPHTEVYYPRVRDSLFIHRSRLPEFQTWCRNNSIGVNLLRL